MKNSTKRLLIVSNILGVVFFLPLYIISAILVSFEYIAYAKILYFFNGTYNLFCIFCFYKSYKIEPPNTICFEESSDEEITFHCSKYVSFYTHIRVFRGDKLIAKIYKDQTFTTFRGKGYFRVKTLMSDFTKVIVPDDNNFIEVYKLEERNVKVKFGNALEEIDTNEEEEYYENNSSYHREYGLPRYAIVAIMCIVISVIL